MKLKSLLDSVRKYKKSFGVEAGSACNKYLGSLAIELLRRSFAERGINTSGRDVFIRGVPVEIDLLIPGNDARPEYGLAYDPSDVKAALEVKTRGCYGQKSLDSVRRAFELIRKGNPHIACAYVTLTELKGYKYAADEKQLECPNVFTLSWHTRKDENDWDPCQKEWERLLNWLKSLPRGGRGSKDP